MMKRLAIILSLFALFFLSLALQKAERASTCECKEGEENCPCLSQKEDFKSIPDKMLQGRVNPLDKESLIKLIGTKIKAKKIAPAEKIKINNLKAELKKLKTHILYLKMNIKTAPFAEKNKLIIEEKALGNKCHAMKLGIKELKAKLRSMKKLYKETCYKKVEEAVLKAKGKITLLRTISNQVKAKTKEIKDTIKVAPKEDKTNLKRQLKDLKLKQRKIIKKLKKNVSFLQRVAKEKKKAIKVNSVSKVNKLRKIVKQTTKKLNKLKEKKAVIKISIISAKKKAKKIQNQLQKPISSSKKIVLQKKLTALTKRITVLKYKKTKIENKAKAIKAAIKAKSKQLRDIKKSLKKKKEASKCTKVRRRLAAELEYIKKLQKSFENECVKAVKTKKQRDIKRVLVIQSNINQAKKEIVKLKKKIRVSPGKKRKELHHKMKKLILKMKEKETALRKLRRKINAMPLTLPVKDQKKLEQKKVQLIKKAAKTEKKIADYKKKIQFVKLKHQQYCNDELLKERRKSKKLITSIRRKLELAKAEAEELKKAIAIRKKISKVGNQLGAITKHVLVAQEAPLKAVLVKQKDLLAGKLKKYKALEETIKRKATALHHDFEAKTNIELAKMKKKTEKTIYNIELLIKESIERGDDLKKALRKAKDPTIKEALQKQVKIEKKKLYDLEKKLKDLQIEKKTIEQEIVFEKQKEAELKTSTKLHLAILEVEFNEKKSNLKKKIMKKAKEEKEKVLANNKAKAEKELDALKQKLALAQAEFQGFRKAYLISRKKKMIGESINLEHLYRTILLKTKEELSNERLNLGKIITLSAKEAVDNLVKYRNGLRQSYEIQISALNKKMNDLISKGNDAKKEAGLRESTALNRIRMKAYKKMNEAQTRLAKLKEEVLEKSMNIKKKYDDAKSMATAAKLQVEMEKKRMHTSAKEHKLWKQNKARYLKDTLAVYNEQYARQIRDLNDEMKAGKKKLLKEEADLRARIKSAKEEINMQNTALTIERGRYLKLYTEKDLWKMNKELSITQDAQKAQSEHAELVKKMKAALEECGKKIKEEKAELEKAKQEFETKMEKIKTLKNVVLRKEKAQKKIEMYESKVLSLTSKSLSLNINLDEACTEELSKGNLSGVCSKYRGELMEIKSKTQEFKEEIDIERATYLRM